MRTNWINQNKPPTKAGKIERKYVSMSTSVIVEYRGGIPEIKKTGDTVVADFPDYLEVKSPGFSLKNHKIPYNKIINVSLVTEGKRGNVLNVEYETVAGLNSVIVLAGKEASKLYNSLQGSRQKYLQRNPIVEQPKEELPNEKTSVDVAAEIQKFFDLKEKGVITEEEFNNKKAQLLNL